MLVPCKGGFVLLLCPSFWGLLMVDIPYKASPHLCFHLHVVSLCTYLSPNFFPLFIRTSIILDQGTAAYTGVFLSLTGSICGDDRYF